MKLLHVGQVLQKRYSEPVCTGQIPFLLSNQQCQSTKVNSLEVLTPTPEYHQLDHIFSSLIHQLLTEDMLHPLRWLSDATPEY